MIVVRGPSDETGFSDSLARSLGAKLVGVEHKLFPDGESYVRIPADLGGETVIIVQPAHYPQDKHLLELMLLADAARGAGASTVVGVAPYLAYTRQDKVFRPGEPVSIRAVLRALHAAGVEVLVTVEPHSRSELEHFPGKALGVGVMRYMASQLAPGLRDPLVLSPDLGGVGRAREFAEALGADFDYLEKRRDRVTGEVSVRPKTLDASGREVVIVDDIISTGGTMALAAKLLLEQGAKRVVAVCVHALLVGEAYAKLKSAGIEDVVAANTLPVPPGVEQIDVAPPVAEALREALGSG